MSLVKVLLAYGGKSQEHEVSLVSAASVLLNLDSKKFEIIPVGIDKDGQCYLNNYQELKDLNTPSLPVRTSYSKKLSSLIKNGRLALDVDVVFPIMHGPLYEDGCFQGVLKLANVAYVGTDVLSSAIGMNKDIARRLIIALNKVKTADYVSLEWSLSEREILDKVQNLIFSCGFPLFVKPCSLGSSVATHKVHNQDELMLALNDARKYDETVLVEEFIKGREIELAVLEDINNPQKPLVSVPGEIKINHKDGFYSYIAKYQDTDKTEVMVPALIDENLSDKFRDIAAEIFIALKCNGMARVDFFLCDNNDIYFNEINTIPGFTRTSAYPKLLQASGFDYSQILESLISLAFLHHKRRNALLTNYQ